MTATHNATLFTCISALDDNNVRPFDGQILVLVRALVLFRYSHLMCLVASIKAMQRGEVTKEPNWHGLELRLKCFRNSGEEWIYGKNHLLFQNGIFFGLQGYVAPDISQVYDSGPCHLDCSRHGPFAFVV